MPLNQARNKASQAINSAMIQAYWSIGLRIVEEEQGGSASTKHGSGLLKQLSKELTAECGKGFPYANLRNFRQF
ncbi:MAG: ribosomal protein S19E (S16A) [Crocinitomicaceae bacterium]